MMLQLALITSASAADLIDASSSNESEDADFVERWKMAANFYKETTAGR